MQNRSINPYERDLAGARFHLWASGLWAVAFLAGLVVVLLKDHSTHRQFDRLFFGLMTAFMLELFLVIAFGYFKVRQEGRALAECTHD